MVITSDTKKSGLTAVAAGQAAATVAKPVARPVAAKVTMDGDDVKLSKVAPKVAPKAEQPSLWTRAVSGLGELVKKGLGWFAVAMCLDWMRASDRQIEKEDEKKKEKAAYDNYVDSVQRSQNAEAQARSKRKEA